MYRGLLPCNAHGNIVLRTIDPQVDSRAVVHIVAVVIIAQGRVQSPVAGINIVNHSIHLVLVCSETIRCLQVSPPTEWFDIREIGCQRLIVGLLIVFLYHIGLFTGFEEIILRRQLPCAFVLR